MEYLCKDGNESYPYDLKSGAECNACATQNCCDSFLACVKDTACTCYLECEGDDAECYSQCMISADPPDFDQHLTCLVDNCADPCEL